MKYMGSKNRLSKHILPIMLKHRKEGMAWVEPFVGGGNMIDKVKGERIGADSNPHVVDALISIRDKLHSLPKTNREFTEQDYASLRTDTRHELFGFASFAYSYSGKFLGGWCRDGKNLRDYVKEAYDNAVKQSPNLQGVQLYHSKYDELSIPPNSIIYCDPPYEGTTKYKDAFNHNLFWQWCRDMVKDGHVVFVSEYNAPDDFTEVFSMEVNSSLEKDTGSKKAVEKLFTYNLQSTP